MLAYEKRLASALISDGLSLLNLSSPASDALASDALISEGLSGGSTAIVTLFVGTRSCRRRWTPSSP